MNLLEVLPPKKHYVLILSFLLGIILAFGFEPFKIPFLPIIVIGSYFLLSDFTFTKFDNYYTLFFYNGLFFGFGFFITGMYWVSNSIIAFDPDLFYIVPIILILLPFCLSIFFAVMQITNAFFWSRSNAKIFYFSSIWIIFEFLRSILFTGLPWNLIGYSWSWSLSFSQSISVLGMYGLGLITIFCSVSLFSYFINSRNKFYTFFSIIILILLYFYGLTRINNNQDIGYENELRIVHTYFDQKDKWTKKAIDQTIAMGSLDLITVFPETSHGLDFNKPNNWIIGYIRRDKENFFNSINYNGFTYDKKILVPFGEYFPFSSLINTIFYEHKIFQNELTKGNKKQLFESNISPLICYEAIFPNFVRDSLSDETKLLVNISNDAWFGNFSGPRQHFVHAQFRSIELGIPLVRSSNKGISGIISPIGEILSITNASKNTYLDVKIPKKLETTFYRDYGNLLAYFLIVLFFIIGYAISLKQEINYE